MSHECCNPKKDMKNKKGGVDKFLLGIVLLTIISLVVVVFFATRSGGARAEIEADTQVETIVTENKYDWGTIDIKGGIATKSFPIKNSGSSALKLFNVKTSCMCTTAQLKTSEVTSKKFQMHENSSDVIEVKPGETAELIVEFDPAFHGPSGVGPITRIITMSTNDIKNPTLTFNLAANVVKK